MQCVEKRCLMHVGVMKKFAQFHQNVLSLFVTLFIRPLGLRTRTTPCEGEALASTSHGVVRVGCTCK